MTKMNDDDSKHASSELNDKIPKVEKVVSELQPRQKTEIDKARRLCFFLFALVVLVGIIVTINLVVDTRKNASLRSTSISEQTTTGSNSVENNIVVTIAPSAVILNENPSGSIEVLAPISVPTPPSDVFYNMSISPTEGATRAPIRSPIISTSIPIEAPKQPVTYLPGNLVVEQNGLKLSEGLTSRLIAQKHQTVEYDSGSKSNEKFHDFPDGAATFTDPDSANAGGWIYVSNSEYRNTHEGGVGAVTFNKDGNVIEYKMILKGTRANCGGGRTPWGGWISCEEYGRGNIWQVDPTGERDPAQITMGNNNPGPFEAFAFDDRNKATPRFFVTKDDGSGEITRFTPSNPNWDDPWNILTGPGSNQYLIINPKSDKEGSYEWTDDINAGKDSASKHFPWTEGIARRGNKLYFIAKKMKMIFILELDGTSYKKVSTHSGLFGDGSDQIHGIEGSSSEILYFTEDGEHRCGIHGLNAAGKYFTILEATSLIKETTGLAFSPDKKHMYVAFQGEGKVFDITRTDNLPFDGEVLDVKYH